MLFTIFRRFRMAVQLFTAMMTRLPTPIPSKHICGIDTSHTICAQINTSTQLVMSFSLQANATVHQAMGSHGCRQHHALVYRRRA